MYVCSVVLPVSQLYTGLPNDTLMYMCSVVLAVSQLYTGLPNDILMYMCSAVLAVSQLYKRPTQRNPNVYVFSCTVYIPAVYRSTQRYPPQPRYSGPTREGRAGTGKEKIQYSIVFTVQEYTQFFSFSKKLLIFLKLNTISI